MSTTTEPKRVLLVGASGALGWEILQQLKTTNVVIRTLSRDPSRAQKLQEQSLSEPAKSYLGWQALRWVEQVMVEGQSASVLQGV